MGKLTRGARNIAWIERYCRIPEGRDAGEAVRLRPWQKRIIRSIYDTPTRTAIISFGRKNAKTTLSAFLLCLHLAGPEAAANPGRPAYAVGDVTSVELGFGSFIEITENWRAVINLSVEQFGDEVGDSPIVDTDRVVRGFAAITYVF